MSTAPSEIARYLTVTRGGHSLNSTLPQLVAAYKETFDRLIEILGAIFLVEIKPPPFVAVYSGIGHAETVLLRGQEHMVYDQYLGQTLNRLNRLFFEDANPNEVNAYLHKVYAARSLVSGKPGRALEHTVAHSMLATRLTRADGGGTFKMRAAYTYWQESFVIAHELAHYIFRAYPRAAYAFQQYCLGIVGLPEGLDDEAMTAQIAALTERRDISRSRDVGPESDELPARLPRLYAMEGLAGAFGLDESDPQTTAQVLEECICDAAAVLAVAVLSSLELGDAICAALLGLHHLRLIRMVDAEIAKSPEENASTSPLPRVVGETQYRFTFFRSLVTALRRSEWRALPDNALNVKVDFLNVGSLALSLSELNDRYDMIIGINSSAIAQTYPQLHEAIQSSADVHTLLEDGEDAHDAVRRICNLPGS